MVHAPVKIGATYQDVIDAPEHMVAELIDGELFLQPRPAKPHAEAASVLGMLIGPPFRLGRGGPGGWWIQDEPELHLFADVLVPDLAGWRKAGMPALDLTEAAYTTPPDWVCEVVSPGTAGKDRVRKLPKYAQAGVKHAWLVDPVQRTLEVFENQGGTWLMIQAFQGPAAVEARPFEAVPLELAELWLAEP